jgi:hypothetical protein
MTLYKILYEIFNLLTVLCGYRAVLLFPYANFDLVLLAYIGANYTICVINKSRILAKYVNKKSASLYWEVYKVQ